jgi:hypothetical protein
LFVNCCGKQNSTPRNLVVSIMPHPVGTGGAGALAPCYSAPAWLSIPSSQSSLSTAARL